MLLASPLVIASLLVLSPAAAPGETGVLMGSVLPSADGRLVAKSVRVGKISAVVAKDGSFQAAGIPAGPAQLAIETSQGLFVVATPVAIAPGTTRRVHLAFAGRQDSSPPTPPEQEKKKKRGGIWANPVSATLIIVGSAIVVGVAVDQLTKSEPVPASPSK
jgi:hypothetical protein